jgi:hypothetical protein
MKLQEIE